MGGAAHRLRQHAWVARLPQELQERIVAVETEKVAAQRALHELHVDLQRGDGEYTSIDGKR